MSDNVTVDETHAVLAGFNQAAQPVPKWFSQVPFNPMLLDLDVESHYVFLSLRKFCIEWFDIGIALKVPIDKLEEIDNDNRKTSIKLAKMIDFWINNCKCHTWRMLIETLFELGLDAAANSAISNACRAIMKGGEMQELPKKIDWDQKAEKRNTFCSKITMEISEMERRERMLVEKLCQLFNIPSIASNDLLLDNINQYILSCPSLTRNHLKEVVFTINIFSEMFHRRYVTLQNWVEELNKDIKSSGEIRALLITRKQELKEHLFKLNEKVEEIKLMLAEKRYCHTEIQSLLQSLANYEATIHNIKHGLDQCVKELHYANCNYQSLSEALSNHVDRLQLALGENKKMKAIAVSCKKLGNVYSRLPLFSVCFILLIYLFQSYSHNIVMGETVRSDSIKHFISIIFFLFIVLIVLRNNFITNMTKIESFTTPKVIFKAGMCAKALSLLVGIISGAILRMDVSALYFLLWMIGFIVTGLITLKYPSVNVIFYRVVVSFISCFGAALATHLRINAMTYLDLQINSMLSVLSSIIMGLTYTILFLQLQTIRTGHFEDPIQYELFRVNVGMIVGVIIASPDHMIIIFGAMFGNVVGVLIALKCVDLHFWHHSSFENVILDISIEVIDDNVNIMTSIINRIKEIQIQLVHIEHPYGDTNSNTSDHLDRSLSYSCSSAIKNYKWDETEDSKQE